jgi:hypothetical protein
LADGRPQRGQVGRLASQPLFQLGDLLPLAQDERDQLLATSPVPIERGIHAGSLLLLFTSEQIPQRWPS